MTERLVSRRGLLATAAVGALAGCSGVGIGNGFQETPTKTPDPGAIGDLSLTAETVAEGFTSPLDLAVLRAGTYLVADQNGTVWRVREDGGTKEVVLDVRERMVSVSGYDERGLLGIALHPDFEQTGRLFIRYSAPVREGTPDSFSHTFVLATFGVYPAVGTVDRDSERPVLEIPQPQANHNAGPIVFGPDGHLYVTVGDGGGANDRGAGHVEDWYDPVGGGNGQDVTENLLGSVLCIDVDAAASDGGDATYGIPEDNPLVDAAGLDEHYAWGLRNPWGLSFGPDGRGFVVDVGQNRFEEVNRLERGGNYGWNVTEGYVCFGADRCPDAAPDGEGFVDPLVTYSHEGGDVSGVAVVGGQHYEGAAMPSLRDTYVFGDWQAEGSLFVAAERAGTWQITPVPVDGAMGPMLLGTATDADGEVLVLTSERGGVDGETGSVARLGE
jgi:glucose/arabinose dehydrogenase